MIAAGQLEDGSLLNGRYRILRALGHGGMGTVYMARHERLESVVAVKEVRDRTGNATEYRTILAQCEQEARFLVNLNHPNLPKVTDAFIEEERFYLVMEYIEGVTLNEMLNRASGSLASPVQVVAWGLQIADVLTYLHSQDPPIIFRDLKPANIMLQPDGNIRLIDFGIARRFQEGANKDTALLGSVGYSPPEQFGRHQTDARSDIYAFGATLHHLLTGRDPAAQPFRFPPANQINASVPIALSDLLTRCLAMDAKDRPASVHEVALQLVAIREKLEAATSAGETMPASEITGKSETGARIVSAKLAQAQKRRPEPYTVVAGAAGPPLTRILALGTVLLVLLGGAATLVFSRTRPKPTQKAIETPIKPPEPMDTPSAPPQETEKKTEVKDPTLLPPSEVSVRDFQMTPQGFVPDDQGVVALRVQVSATILNRYQANGQVALFLYDGNGKPLQARTEGSQYANPEGQLSVSQTLTVLADTHPFRRVLSVPISEFADPDAANGLKARAVLYLDKQRVATTEMLELVPIQTPASRPTPLPSGGGIKTN